MRVCGTPAGEARPRSNIYPTGIDITRPEHNQEVTLYPQELTSTLLIQKLSGPSER